MLLKPSPPNGYTPTAATVMTLVIYTLPTCARSQMLGTRIDAGLNAQREATTERIVLINN